MRMVLGFLGLALIVAVGCRRDTDPAHTPGPPGGPAPTAEGVSDEEPQAQPIPEAEFDPADRERTFRSIGEAATALKAAYRPATRTKADRSREGYSNGLRGFESRIHSFAGRDVTWKVAVKQVTERGVVIDGTSRFPTDRSSPGNVGQGVVQVFTIIRHATPDGKDSEAFDEVLWYGEQIERGLAEDAKPGDVIVLKAHVRQTRVLAIEDSPPNAIAFFLDGVRAQARLGMSKK